MREEGGSKRSGRWFFSTPPKYTKKDGLPLKRVQMLRAFFDLPSILQSTFEKPAPRKTRTTLPFFAKGDIFGLWETSGRKVGYYHFTSKARFWPPQEIFPRSWRKDLTLKGTQEKFEQHKQARVNGWGSGLSRKFSNSFYGSSCIPKPYKDMEMIFIFHSQKVF